MDDTLGDYARKLNSALIEKSGYATFNRDAVHASIVIHIAFLHAKETVLLLSQKLDTLIYSNPWLIKKIESFLARGGKLRVLVETEVAESHPLRLLANQLPKSLTIARVPQEAVGTYSFNFMVVDDRGYRFEHDREEYSAVVAFDEPEENHTELVEAMQQRFQELEAQSVPL